MTPLTMHERREDPFSYSYWCNWGPDVNDAIVENNISGCNKWCSRQPSIPPRLPLFLWAANRANVLDWIKLDTLTKPSGVLDDETPSALVLAQRVRGFVTKATHGRWCPAATEQEIRDNILELRTMMMSQGECGAESTHRLAELTRNLQVNHTSCCFMYD